MVGSILSRIVALAARLPRWGRPPFRAPLPNRHESGQHERFYTGPYKKGDIKKVVLAYSGGLDTSVILKWL